MKWKICGVSELPEHLTWATHVISISSPDFRHEVPPFPPPLRVWRVDMDDIDSHPAPSSALAAPCLEDLRDLIYFGQKVPEDGRLLIHCQMGISRSTAAMLAILCARDPSLSPADGMGQIAASRPIAMPNRLIVRLADQFLKRKGLMVQTVEEHWKTQSQRWTWAEEGDDET